MQTSGTYRQAHASTADNTDDLTSMAPSIGEPERKPLSLSLVDAPWMVFARSNGALPRVRIGSYGARPARML